jgi:uncharacterized protein (TIGR02996 family)
MTSDGAFLRAIQANPGDVALRLVYADFLEERGDPRAELIRIHCELAAMPPGDPRRHPLQIRGRSWWNRHGRTAFPALHRCKSHELRLGLVETITLSPTRFLDHAAELFRLGPLCRVTLAGPPGCGRYMTELAASEYLGRCAALDLSYNFLNDAAVATLTTSPHLGTLHELCLCHNFIRDAGAQALAAAPTLAGLGRLDLEGNTYLGDAGRLALRDRFGDRVYF